MSDLTPRGVDSAQGPQHPANGFHPQLTSASAPRAGILTRPVRTSFIEIEVRAIPTTLAEFRTSDPRMKALIGDLARIKGNHPLMFSGETGVGKGVLARLVHNSSERGNRQFQHLNCGAFKGEILRSELFGHSKGAFTGADREKMGQFAAANGGTIFLDEIEEMDPAMQVTLLTALDEGRYHRVGDHEERRSDVRVIAATNRNLSLGYHADQFRTDLYFRLGGLQFEIPPLRERQDDLRDYIKATAAEKAREYRSTATGFSTEAFDRLMAYPWPGNLREMRLVVGLSVMLAEGDTVGTSHIRFSSDYQPTEDSSRLTIDFKQGVDYQRNLKVFDAAIIKAALESSASQSEAARKLGITRGSLRNKMREAGMRFTAGLDDRDE